MFQDVLPRSQAPSRAVGLARLPVSGLQEIDEGYQLKYVLYDEHELIMDTVIGHVFTVGIGERYQLEIVSQPEMAYGGSVFGSQPVLAVRDRGGNVVTDVNEGMVCYFCVAS